MRRRAVRSKVTGRAVSADPPSLLALAALALAVAATLALGCASPAEEGRSDASSIRDLSTAVDGGAGPAGGPAGNLPPGWWERGCGWDAPCGDPRPIRGLRDEASP